MNLMVIFFACIGLGGTPTERPGVQLGSRTWSNIDFECTLALHSMQSFWHPRLGCHMYLFHNRNDCGTVIHILVTSRLAYHNTICALLPLNTFVNYNGFTVATPANWLLLPIIWWCSEYSQKVLKINFYITSLVSSRDWLKQNICWMYAKEWEISKQKKYFYMYISWLQG